MIYYLLVIAGLTLVFWGLYQAKLWRLCPVCAAVVITWAGSLVALYTGAAWADPLIIAILLGASLGALAEKLGHRLGLMWKTGVVLLGLPAIYFLVQRSVWPGLGLVAAILLLTWFGRSFTRPGSRASQGEPDLFKDCC